MTTTTDADGVASEQVLDVKGGVGRWPMASIWIVSYPLTTGGTGWEARIDYSYGRGGGAYGIGPLGSRDAAILEAVRRLDRDLPAEGRASGFWASSPEADRRRITTIRDALAALRQRVAPSSNDLPLFGGTPQAVSPTNTSA